MTSRALAWVALVALIATMAIALMASWGGSGAGSDGGPTLKSPIAKNDGTNGSARRRV